MPQKLLVLEDEENIRSFVVINLKRAGYDVIEAGTGEEALRLITAHPDTRLALLDIMLPGALDGLEVCRRLRAAHPGMGVIMLTAKTQELDKVTGLVSGADDYITKPFSPTELIARVDALSRRLGGGGEPSESSAKLRSGPFTLSARNRTLQKNGVKLKLTQVEFNIIKLFMENPDRALSREEILRRVWGEEYFGDLKIVDVNIRRLRIKIEDDTANPAFITTVWGFGYKWGG
ncbi:MAG: response regulator transcription factor [Oscillospiraceae bacterium]|jgi:DNA-binding response OmpR family regulator|nr:response regulator transcription factor [Oscillospiraceae bacterium]